MRNLFLVELHRLLRVASISGDIAWGGGLLCGVAGGSAR